MYRTCFCIKIKTYNTVYMYDCVELKLSLYQWLVVLLVLLYYY